MTGSKQFFKENLIDFPYTPFTLIRGKGTIDHYCYFRLKLKFLSHELCMTTESFLSTSIEELKDGKIGRAHV